MKTRKKEKKIVCIGTCLASEKEKKIVCECVYIIREMVKPSKC